MNDTNTEKRPKLFSGLGKESFEPASKPSVQENQAVTRAQEIEQMKKVFKRRSYDISEYNIKRSGLLKLVSGKELNDIANEAITEYLDKLNIKLPGEE